MFVLNACNVFCNKGELPNKLIQRDFQSWRGFCKKTAKATPALKAPDEGVGCKNKTPIHHKQSHHRPGFVKMMALFRGIDEAMAVDRTEKKMKPYLTGLQ